MPGTGATTEEVALARLAASVPADGAALVVIASPPAVALVAVELVAVELEESPSMIGIRGHWGVERLEP